MAINNLEICQKCQSPISNVVKARNLHQCKTFSFSSWIDITLVFRLRFSISIRDVFVLGICRDWYSWIGERHNHNLSPEKEVLELGTKTVLNRLAQETLGDTKQIVAIIVTWARKLVSYKLLLCMSLTIYIYIYIYKLNTSTWVGSGSRSILKRS